MSFKYESNSFVIPTMVDKERDRYFSKVHQSKCFTQPSFCVLIYSLLLCAEESKSDIMVFPVCSLDLNSFSMMKQLNAAPPRDLRTEVVIYLFLLKDLVYGTRYGRRNSECKWR